jgi:phospholipase/carboxylesterase
LRYPRPLAGVIALSSYLLFADRIEDQRSDANASLPAFVAHGSVDPVVPIAMGESAARVLEAMGHPVEWHTYPMAHAVSPEEIQHLAAWMQKHLE